LPGDVDVILVNVFVFSDNGARGHVVELNVVRVATAGEGGWEGGREGGGGGGDRWLMDEEMGGVGDGGDGGEGGGVEGM